MSDITDPGTINNGDTPDWDAVQEYFDAIYAIINSPGQLDNSNIKTAAAIAYSKLALTGSIVNADVNSSAAIGVGKLGIVPAVRLEKASQSMADTTEAAITFTSEVFDTDTMHSNGVNPARITFTTAGIYQITAELYFSSYANPGDTYIKVKSGGATVLAQDLHNETLGATLSRSLKCSTIYSFAASQYVELYVYQGSGGALSAQEIKFSAARIGSNF